MGGSRRTSGQGSVYVRRDGRWVGQVLLPTGGRKYVYGRTQREVTDKMAKVVADAGAGVMPAPERLTVGDVLHQWLTESANYTVRPSTYRSYSAIARLHLVPELGRVRLNTLEPYQVERLLRKKLDAGLSPRRVQYIHAVLRRALNRAVRWGWVGRNVATLVDAPRVRRRRRKPFTPDEIGRLFDELEGERLEALYVLALTTGLRQGELLALFWSDVDLSDGRLSVTRSLQRIDGRVDFVEPKSERSVRTVPVPQFACEVLSRHRQAQTREREAAGARWHGGDDLVFCTVDGRPLHGGTVTHHFYRILERAKIPRRRFHDLRHSCATVLAAKHVPPRVAMEILGHSQISLTMEVYTDVLSETQREAGEQMDEFMRGLVRTKRSDGVGAVRSDPVARA